MKKPFLPLAALFGLVLLASMHDAAALSQPLGELRDTEVACSASVPTLINGADGLGGVSSLYIANDSATCVRVGGSAVSATTGASIGDGCRDGNGITVDARRAYCLSTSGSITVDVVYGVQ